MSSLKHLRWRGKHRTRGGLDKGERTTVVLGEQVYEKEGGKQSQDASLLYSTHNVILAKFVMCSRI